MATQRSNPFCLSVKGHVKMLRLVRARATGMVTGGSRVVSSGGVQPECLLVMEISPRGEAFHPAPWRRRSTQSRYGLRLSTNPTELSPLPQSPTLGPQSLRVHREAAVFVLHSEAKRIQKKLFSIIGGVVGAPFLTKSGAGCGCTERKDHRVQNQDQGCPRP